MLYNCAECSSLIEILSIDLEKNNIEFNCLNNNNDTHRKKMQLKEYLEKMKKYNNKNINKDKCQIHKNNIYSCYCFDCNLHLCKECLKNRAHLRHYKNCIDEIQPVKEELDLIDEIIKDYEIKIENLGVKKVEKIKELENSLNDSITKENNILDEKIKMDKEEENKELDIIKQKYLSDISEMKKKILKRIGFTKKSIRK